MLSYHASISCFVNASGFEAARQRDDGGMIGEELLHVSMDHHHHQAVSENHTRRSRLHYTSRAAVSDDAVQPPRPRADKCYRSEGLGEMLTLAQRARQASCSHRVVGCFPTTREEPIPGNITLVLDSLT